MTARDLLRWLHDRCEFVYHESPNLDWMHALRALADRIDAEEKAGETMVFRNGPEGRAALALLARLDAPL
jgi:hypothetical protein